MITKRRVKKVVNMSRHTGRLLIGGEFDTLLHKTRSVLRRYGHLDSDGLEKVLKILEYKMTALGYPDRAFAELKGIASSSLFNPYIRARAAWYLINRRLLNSYSENDLISGIKHLSIVKRSKKFRATRGYYIDICEINALTRLGETSKAASAIKQIMRKDPLYADAYLTKANLLDDVNGKLEAINAMLSQYNISPIYFTDEASSHLFDRLGYLPDESCTIYNDGPLVSVIMPAYNSAQTIGVSLNSILNQTWKNLEVIVVDDCSADKTADVVKEFMNKDKRVSLVVNQTNSGAYFSRNTALKKSRGELVTVLDADDWCHPDKIALQVKDLQENPEAMGNVSYLSRASDDLVFIRKGSPRSLTQLNTSSLLLRKKRLLDTFGYWDSVRFSADSELYFRIKRTLGEDSIRELPQVPLSFARQSDTSLTGSGPFGLEGFPKGARKLYRELYNLYQQEGGDIKYSFPMKERPFYAPKPMRFDYDKNNTTTYDLVLIGDFRDINNPICQHALKEIRNNTSNKIALLQRCEYETPIMQDVAADLRRSFQQEIAEMIVFGESVHTKTAIVDPLSIDNSQLYIPDLTAEHVVQMVYRRKAPSKYRFDQASIAYPAKDTKVYFYDEGAQRNFNNVLESLNIPAEKQLWTEETKQG